MRYYMLCSVVLVCIVNLTWPCFSGQFLANMNNFSTDDEYKAHLITYKSLLKIKADQNLLLSNIPDSNTVSQMYTLPTAARTSAGVYDGEILVRTLWNNEPQKAGTYSLVNAWDGKDDDGNYVADKNYMIKVISSNVTYEWLTPIGNTSVLSVGSGVYHSAQLMTNMVQVGENMYYGVGYNEIADVHCKFVISQPNVNATTLKGGGQMIRYLATDGDIVYSAGQRDSSTAFITGIIPTQNGIEKLADFSAGTPCNMPSGSNFTYSAFNITDNHNYITGLAVQKTGDLLFASHNSLSQIRIFNKKTGALLQTTFVYAPRDIAFQNDSTVWISHYSDHTGSTVSTNLTGYAISTNPNNEPVMAFDGQPTVFKTNGGSQNSIGLSFDPRIIVTKIRVYPETGSNVDGTIVGSNGHENTLLARVSIEGGSFTDFNVQNTNPFDQIRLINSNDTQLKIQEMEVYGYNYSGTPVITKHTVAADGAILPATLTISGLTSPLAMAVSPDGNKIAVADRGIYHQVKLYDTATGWLSSTIGRAENYNNPTVYDDKFYFSNTRIFREDDYGAAHAFVAYQSDGSLWIGDYGNMRCQQFRADGSYANTIQYMGYSYSSQADVNAPTRVFSDFLEFKINYTDNSWRFVRNWSGKIAAPTVFDSDRMRSVVTLSNNRTYALYSKPGTGTKEIIELDSIKGIRFTGQVLDSINFNCDLNPDGSIWQMGNNSIGQPTFWKRKALTGFDSDNNLQWGSYVTLETTPEVMLTDPLTADNGLRRLQQSSSGLIATFCSDNGKTDRGRGYHLGGFRNGQWVFKTSSSTRTDYVGDMPPDGVYDIGNGVNNPGSFMQVVDRHIFWGYTGEFWKNSETNIYNHYLDNGMVIGQFGYSLGYLTRLNTLESAPADAGNALSGTYVKVDNDIHFFHCDENQHAAVHHWKISNLNSIQEFNIPFIKKGIPTMPAPEYVDLMTSLPESGTLNGPTGRWSYSSSVYRNSEYDRWQIEAGRTVYKRADRSLRFSWYPVENGQTREAYCDLGSVNSTTWRIEGELSYPELGEADDNFLEVLDAAGKVLVRVSRPNVYPNLTIKANDKTIVSDDQGALRAVIYARSPLIIRRVGNSIYVKYADYPEVNAGLLDGEGNINNPASLRVHFYSSYTRGHQMDLANLKLYVTSTTVVDDEGRGLTGEYFNNTTLSPPATSVRIDSMVNFNWEHSSPIPGVINADYFSVRWSGQVQAPISGTYVFSTACDDSIRLWVNGNLVIDHLGYLNTVDYSSPITLSAGQKYDIKLEYNEMAHEAKVQLMWEYPAQVQQPIPTTYLYPDISNGGTNNTIGEIVSNKNYQFLDNTKAYPVPAYDFLWVQYYAEETGNLSVKLINMSAQPVLLINQQVIKGDNILKIPVKELPRGLYLLSLIDSNRQISKRVILSHQ